MQTTAELLNLLELKQHSETVFEGQSNFMGSPNVFGGQVVAQALNAAIRTVPAERICHSLHCYFILPGNLALPIMYHVMDIRDGGSFTTRFIQAKQNDVPIFVMAASFQKVEEGYFHQVPMPKVPMPEELSQWINIDEETHPHIATMMKAYLNIPRPLEMRSCQPDLRPGEDANPENRVWFRFKEAPAHMDWKTVQQCIAYASDYNVLSTALHPHTQEANFLNTQLASLDHAIWFHQETDLSDWLLFDLISTIASGARGLTTGHIFDRSGRLIASVSQEGLMRPRSGK
jgi:acyl-CoA thioesterase-2